LNRFNNTVPQMPQNLSDDQMNASINMIKTNPDMVKSMMKANGMNMDDAQLDMMMKMMNPEMMKMAQNMQKSGVMPPNFGGNTQNAQDNTQAPAFPNMGEMPDMNGPQGEQMKKMASEMFSNPETLKGMMNMFTNDENGPLMQILKSQFPNANPKTLSR